MEIKLFSQIVHFHIIHSIALDKHHKCYSIVASESKRLGQIGQQVLKTLC